MMARKPRCPCSSWEGNEEVLAANTLSMSGTNLETSHSPSGKQDVAQLRCHFVFSGPFPGSSKTHSKLRAQNPQSAIRKHVPFLQARMPHISITHRFFRITNRGGGWAGPPDPVTIRLRYLSVLSPHRRSLRHSASARPLASTIS